MIHSILHSAVHTIDPTSTIDTIEVSTPPSGQSGDFAFACFALAKKTGNNPAAIASQLAEILSTHSLVSSAQATGPFVNVTMSSDFYGQTVQEFSLPTYADKGQTVIVDYNQPNIGKPLHIAHLCTPSFGQPAINLLRKMGYTVYGDMHQGDWGGIFGKLIVAWEKWGDENEFSIAPIDHLLDLYIRVTAAAKEDEAIDQACRDAFRKLSDGDTSYVDLWKRFTAQSLGAVNEALTPFGIHPNWKVGESFYEGLDLPKLGDWPDLKKPEQTMSFIVEELIKKGIATRNEDGSAGVVFPKETKLPSCILQKRDGTHGYLASDLATIKYRMANWSPSQILYFVDNRQALHFRQLFWIATQAWDIPVETLSHEQNGFVSLPDGAMSTREGRIVRLGDLVKESFRRTGDILQERNRELDDTDISAISIGAIKYTFLAQDRERDWVFDWDRVLAFEGNSGPYVQYSIVRLKKLLEEFEDTTYDGSSVSDLTKFDIALVSDLIFLESELQRCGSSYKFHTLVNYCYEIANHVNSFYTNTTKLTLESNKSLLGFRVSLVRHVCDVLELCMEILAIPIPKKM